MIHDKNRWDKIVSKIKNEKTPYDTFCVMTYRSKDPNKIESGINEYSSTTGESIVSLKKVVIVDHVCPISISIKYKASAPSFTKEKHGHSILL